MTRFSEIDIIRGFALVLMILYHFFWDLDFFGILPLDHSLYSSTVSIVPITFLAIVGVSLSITYDRYKFQKPFLNALLILVCGICLSALSFLALPHMPIYFGVLHCIGVSMLLCLLLIRLRTDVLFVASLAIIVSSFVLSISIPGINAFTYMLGIHSVAVTSVDYFPLLPWFGYCLLGVSIGKTLYKDGKRQFTIPELLTHNSLFSYVGKHSLGLYLIHQPVLVAALKVFMYLRYVKL